MAMKRVRPLELFMIAGVCAFAMLCLYHFGGAWEWGHNGFNGAAFFNAARNSLRFGIVGQVQYYMGLEPPPPEKIYTHHPMMLHAHLVLLGWLLGFQAWVGRLVPALYSLGYCVLLGLMARRFLGRLEGALAVTICALVPLAGIFANMINHEQGGIFWCLMTCLCYLRWQETREAQPGAASMPWKWALGLLGSVTCAAQFDWPAYYVAFFLALHMGARGVREGRAAYLSGARGRALWPASWTLLIAFSVCVLANFFGFFGWIIYTRGSLDEMMGSYEHRSSDPKGYWELVWARSGDLLGAHLLVGLLLWALTSLWRLARGKARPIELVIWIFIGAQAIHSTVFKQAGFIHAYWVYYLVPALSLGLAQLVALPLRALWRRPQTWSKAAAIGLGVVAFGAQASWWWQHWSWGVDAHHGAYADREGQDEEIALMRWMGGRHLREETRYLLDADLHARIEQAYYLDAPNQVGARATFSKADLEAREATVMIFDMARAPQKWAMFAKLIEAHGAEIIDDRFFVVQSIGTPGEVRWWRSEGEGASALSRWVFGSYGGRQITPISAASAPDALQGFKAPHTRLTRLGGTGGVSESWRCGLFGVLVGLDVQSAQGKKSDFVGGISPVCRDVWRGVEVSPWLGKLRKELDAPPITRLQCGEGEVVVGLHGHGGALVDGLGLICGREDGSKDHMTRMLGGRGGKPMHARCAAGEGVVGLEVRGGSLIDGIVGLCQRPNEGQREE